MSDIEECTDFDPIKDIPPLDGKVVFITGGTAGLGAESVKALAKHSPAHIYFTGRNTTAGDSLISDVREVQPSVSLTFIEMDMSSLESVKDSVSKGFTHDRLDILMCNAGIMATPPSLSKDGFEIQFAVNHLAHAMILHILTPVLLKTSEEPLSDVRVVSLTSLGWQAHPKHGIVFDKLRTMQDTFSGSWIRYGQSKLANIVYAAEVARRYPSIISVSVHPGVVSTGLVTNLSPVKKAIVHASNLIQGISLLPPEKGAYSQLWAAAGAKQSKMVNGALYLPIGVESNHTLDSVAKGEELASKLWDWTQEVLAQH